MYAKYAKAIFLFFIGHCWYQTFSMGIASYIFCHRYFLRFPNFSQKLLKRKHKRILTHLAPPGSPIEWWHQCVSWCKFMHPSCVPSCKVMCNKTDTFLNLNKYILEFAQIHFGIWTNTYWNLDKYILKFGQIHIGIWTNTVDANLCIRAACWAAKSCVLPRNPSELWRLLSSIYLYCSAVLRVLVFYSIECMQAICLLLVLHVLHACAFHVLYICWLAFGFTILVTFECMYFFLCFLFIGMYHSFYGMFCVCVIVYSLFSIAWGVCKPSVWVWRVWASDWWSWPRNVASHSQHRHKRTAEDK